MIHDRFGKGAENDAQFFQVFLEGCCDRDTIKHRVHGYAGETLSFFQGDTQFFVCSQQFRIDFIKACRSVAFLFGRCIVADSLIVRICIVYLCPLRFSHFGPLAIGFQTPLQHPFRFALLRRYEADDFLIQSWSNLVLINIGNKTVFILLREPCFDCKVFLIHQ